MLTEIKIFVNRVWFDLGERPEYADFYQVIIMKKIIHSLSEMNRLAKDLVADLSGGEVIALVGGLGAGKTTLTQYLAKHLGVTERVNSPTFVLLKIYKARHSRIKRLVHLDCYRLADEADLNNLGWDDWRDRESVTVLEWADKVWPHCPRGVWQVKLTARPDGSRLAVLPNFKKQPGTKAETNHRVRQVKKT